MIKKIYIGTILLSLIVSISSCAKIEKGYKLEENTLKKMQEMVDENATIDDFLFYFGSPSFTNYPKNDIVCYGSAKGKRIAFDRFYKPEYTFICIKFENKKSKELLHKTLKSIKKQKMTDFDITFDKQL